MKPHRQARLAPSTPSTPRRAALAALGGVALAACGTAPTTRPAAAPRTIDVPPPPSALVVERHWLQQWFAGTPVVIAQSGSGPVAVEVPLAFSFDAGRAAVKPPLAAVLDKLAESLRRQPTLRLTLVAAPGDRGSGDEKLASQRAAAIRSRLAGRGVASSQLALPSTTPGAAVRMRLESP